MEETPVHDGLSGHLTGSTMIANTSKADAVCSASRRSRLVEVLDLVNGGYLKDDGRDGVTELEMR